MVPTRRADRPSDRTSDRPSDMRSDARFSPAKADCVYDSSRLEAADFTLSCGSSSEGYLSESCFPCSHSAAISYKFVSETVELSQSNI